VHSRCSAELPHPDQATPHRTRSPAVEVGPTGACNPRSPDQTLLHRTIREQLEPFLARARNREQPAPRFVEQELRAFLRCGILAHGFLRLHCDRSGA